MKYIFNGKLSELGDIIDSVDDYENVQLIYDTVTFERNVRDSIINGEWIQVTDEEKVVIDDVSRDLVELFPASHDGGGYQFIGVYIDEVLNYFIVPCNTLTSTMVIE